MFPSYAFDKGLIITIAKTSKQKNPPQTIKVGSRLNNSSKEDIKVANRCVEKKKLSIRNASQNYSEILPFCSCIDCYPKDQR